MGKVLSLTSPTMKGERVRTAQQQLTTNPFGNFKPGPVDGEFGERTAGAVRRAKFWLGYPEKSIDSRYGEEVRSYLTKEKPLPLLYRNRRAARLRAAKSTPLRVRAYNIAVKGIGTKERPPGSNRVMYSIWYGLIGAWCAMFDTFNYVTAGSKKTFKRGERYAYCPYMVRDARYGYHGMALLDKHEVLLGDIVMYDWDNDGISDHTGQFERWLDSRKTKFTAIEGNTSGTNNSDGGAVERRERNMSDVIALIRAEV